ncbi:hypothetical protein CYMTET_35742 [Cymbomonas tetramitiformis]|uniref:Uncharacterized protein n=1 Tax=Cymbomonas tetramitiformis TaxID=36881 RepID=A0AAE0F8U2_9CHLO|nr:hypothetical protein CYMTET_35742 [Cymbomonas tetramitiformis]
MDLLCPTHCSSAAKILGLFRERLNQKEEQVSGIAKQMLHLLFRMVATWSAAADDPKNEEMRLSDLPTIVVRFLPGSTTGGTTPRELLERITVEGDAEWLEGYQLFRYMAIFFVFPSATGSDSDTEDDFAGATGDEDSFGPYVNDVLNVICEENAHRFKSIYKAHVSNVNKNGLSAAKKLLSYHHSLMQKDFDATGNALDDEACIDLSFAPVTPGDMYKIVMPFLTANRKMHSCERHTEDHLKLDKLFGPRNSREDKLAFYERHFPDVNWRTLIEPASNGTRDGHAWNLNAPFVITIGESDFTLVSWEHTVPPVFRTLHADDRREIASGGMVDDEAMESDDVEEEEDPEASHDEWTTVRSAGSSPSSSSQLTDVLEGLHVRAMAEASDDDGASSPRRRTESFPGDDEDDLAFFSKAHMGKRARESVRSCMRRRHGATDRDTDVEGDRAGSRPRLSDELATNESRAFAHSHLSYGFFDPEGIICRMVKRQREVGQICKQSGMYIARGIMENYWMDFYNDTKQLEWRECTGLYRQRLSSLLRNFFMCVMCPKASCFRAIMPMPDALAGGLKPFMDALDEARYQQGRRRETLQVPGLPYCHPRLSCGLQYVADFWSYLDKAVRVECLHYMGFMLHMCYTSVYATPFDEYERLPHVWMSGLHSVGKSFLVTNVAKVSLPSSMVEQLSRETAGASYISHMTSAEQLKTYKVKIYTETPLQSMGIGRHCRDTDANAKIKAEMTGDEIALKRSFRNEQTNRYELENLVPKVRELLVFVMNQPLYEVEPNLQSRGLDMLPSRLNRVRTNLAAPPHQRPCCKAFGNRYHISASDDEAAFERDCVATARGVSTKESGLYGNAEAICEGNVRARLFYFGALYQTAVRVRLCHGVDMTEVLGRQLAFSETLRRIPLVTPDKLTRRLDDIKSFAYTLTVHTAVWRVFASADSPFKEAREFDASMLLEVDKNAVCSSSVALFAFSAVAKSMINEPMRMMLFYGRYVLLRSTAEELRHPARETTPIETVSDTFVEDTDYYILSNTLYPKMAAPTKGLSRSDIVAQDHFIRHMLAFYEMSENVRRYGKDTLTVDYAKALLTEFVSTNLFCIRDCVDNGRVCRALCVSTRHMHLEGHTIETARIDDDGLMLHKIVQHCFDANTRRQRLLVCDAARVFDEVARNEVCIPQLPQHVDVPPHASTCALSRLASAAPSDEDVHASGIVDPELKCREDEGCDCFRSAMPKYSDGANLTEEERGMPLEDVGFNRRILEMRLVKEIPGDAAHPEIEEYRRLVRAHHPTLCEKTARRRSGDEDSSFYPVSDIDRIVDNTRAPARIAERFNLGRAWKSCVV